MAQLTASSADSAFRLKTGTLASVAAGEWVPLSPGGYSLVLSGTWVATVVVEYSHDGGATAVATTTLDGVAASFTTAGARVGNQPEGNVLVRVRTSAWTSGSVAWRISQ